MKQVIITGANRGLGLELLKVYLDNQQQVFPVVRTEEALNYLLRNFPRNCYPILADLTKDESKEIIKTYLGRYTDSIDILINNAGISGKGHEIDQVETRES
ncbi:hypothetical protein XYCOK13_42220 [Xylanibacillus composti]|uniref:SDR family NAD(P)-dependent oxidoreductase n=1 Tax=Xylanibacillus composti TaxID=1572762 RepID=A0A8J4H5M2_9BACL|nr:hypothetical protein XYCOK13_42220 [Xylanibacillus composti]